MRYFSLLVLACVAAIWFDGMASAQTKEETKEFLIDKCRRTEPSGKVVIDYSVSFDGEFIIKERKVTRNGRFDYKETWKVKLESLNPKRVEPSKQIGAMQVDCYATGDKKLVEHVQTNAAGKVTNLPSENCINFVFEAADERRCVQVTKAMSHLIKLSGGKTELFDD